MTELPIYVCRTNTPEGQKDYVTCIDPKRIYTRGLAPEVIIGVLSRPVEECEEITPTVFSRNRVFVEFMHTVIARRAPYLPGFIAEAHRQANGWVFVIDQRTRTPQGAVPPEDIVGGFQVKDGEVVPESYAPNPNHRILSADGFFRLGSELQPCLLEELERL